MACSNCGAKLSCGCQKRRASDGKQCCSNCIGSYENSIQKGTQLKKFVWDIGKR